MKVSWRLIVNRHIRTNFLISSLFLWQGNNENQGRWCSSGRMPRKSSKFSIAMMGIVFQAIRWVGIWSTVRSLLPRIEYSSWWKSSTKSESCMTSQLHTKLLLLPVKISDLFLTANLLVSTHVRSIFTRGAANCSISSSRLRCAWWSCLGLDCLRFSVCRCLNRVRKQFLSRNGQWWWGFNHTWC